MTPKEEMSNQVGTSTALVPHSKSGRNMLCEPGTANNSKQQPIKAAKLFLPSVKLPHLGEGCQYA